MLIPLLLALVRLFTLFGGLSAEEASNSALILHLESCPNNTSFFRQGEAQAAEACYLCRCKDGGVAECWIRESWRCEVENKQRSKRDSRVKRSPLGFSELFFRDAARDLFNLREPEQCKPFGESYSEGCPPEDWCIGCTICDCDANGRWDCHVLSFCDDEKGNKSMKKRYKGDLRRRGQRTRTTTTTTTPAPTKTNITKPTKRHNKKWFKVTKKPIERKVAKRTLMPKLKERDLIHGPVLKNKPTKAVIRKNVTKNALLLNHKTKPLIKSDIIKSNNSVMYAKNLARTLLGTVNKIIIKSIEDQSKLLQAKQNKEITSAIKKENVKSLIETNKDENKLNARNTSQAKAKKGFVKKAVKRKAISKNIKMQDKENVYRNKRSISEDNLTNNSTKAAYEAGHYIKPDHTETTKVDNYYLIDPMNANFYSINDMNVTDKEANIIDTINQFNNTYVISNEAIGSFEFKYNNQTTTKNLKDNGIDFVTNSSKYKMEPSNKDLLIQPILGEVNINKADSYEHKVKIRDYDIEHLNDSYMNYETETTHTIEKERLTTVSYANNLTPNKRLDEKVDKLLLKIIKSENDVSVKQKNFTTPNEIDATHKIIGNRLNIIAHTSARTMIMTNKSLNFKFIPKSNETEYLHTNNNTDNKVDSWLNKWYKGYKTKKYHSHTPKKNKFNFLKYFRNLFGRIFALNKKKESNVHKRRNLLNILCKNNGSINPQMMSHLQLKVKELYSEANKILRILKILKGLLRILDFDLEGKPLKKNETGVSNFMNDDTRKLNAVLKGKYDKNINKLSDSQIRQVEYIKNNTNEFIKSMEAFSCILIHIIRILKTHNYDADIKTVSKNHVRPTRGFKESQTMEKSLVKFQNLISTYNLAQNNFLKRLQEALRSLDNKYPSKVEIRRNFIPKVSLKNNKENYAASIEIFTKNIIENLRRLRNLAMKMNYNDRRKRETMHNDGTVEYLLTLMEYLLKHHYPLQKQVENVHDGIDLLLQVISNAPDIKSIQHIHSQNSSLNFLRRMLITTEATSPLYPLITNDIDDVSSTEVTKKDNNISAANKNEIESSQQFSNDDQNDKNNAKYNMSESAAEQSASSIFNNTDSPYLEKETSIAVYTVTEVPKDIRDIYKYIDNNDTSVENIFERSLRSRLLDAEQKVKTSSIPTEIKEDKEIYINYKQRNEESSEKKKYDVYAAVLEEEREVDVPITTTEASSEKDQEFSTSMSTVPPQSSFISEAPINQYKPLRAKYYLPDLEDISVSEKGIKRDRINWVDEVYEHEFKEYLLTNESISEFITTQTAVTDEHKSESEEESYAPNTKARKMRIDKEPRKKTIEIIMKKKQLDLLNSLDYGTEKTEVVNLHDDENSGDAFPNFLS